MFDYEIFIYRVEWYDELLKVWNKTNFGTEESAKNFIDDLIKIDVKCSLYKIMVACL